MEENSTVPSSPDLHSCYTPCSFPIPNKLFMRMSFNLPDDIVSLIAEYYCDRPVDFVSLMLVSRQFHQQLDSTLSKFCLPDGLPLLKQESLLSSDAALYFAGWSSLHIGQPPAYVSWRSSGPCYYCRNCKSCILPKADVESDQYQGGLGPAFLARSLVNCRIHEDHPYSTQFTTGLYVVCDFHCINCDAALGKKYLQSQDASNRFKVGKFLVEQTLLEPSRCCLKSSLPTGFCLPCLLRARAVFALFVLPMDITRLSLLRDALINEAGEQQGLGFRGRLVGLLAKVTGRASETWAESLGTRVALLPDLDQDYWSRSYAFMEILLNGRRHVDRVAFFARFIFIYSRLGGKNLEFFLPRLNAEEREAVQPRSCVNFFQLFFCVPINWNEQKRE